ncbi:MAG: serine/threonine-protein kinase [Planctomycetota bacterium]|nr:serine/threonine-protein kinase [Planctomycetota bacterium]
MLSFDAIVAARAAIHNGANPLATRQALLDLDTGLRTETLLWALVNANQLTEETARLAHEQKQRYLFLRAESAYIHCARHFKHVEEDELQKARDLQKENNFANRLGHYLVKAELISAELDEDIKNKALISLEKENQKVIDKSRDSDFFDIEGMPAPVKESFNSDPEVAVSQIVEADEAKEMLANLEEFMDNDDEEEVPEAPPPPSAAPDLRRDRNSTRAFTNVEAAASLGDPLAGTGLETRYRLIDKLGQGGMGAVYLAYDGDFDDRRVALKIAIDAENNEDAINRFKREILCNSFFDHNNVIEIYDGGKTDNGHFYMAMEYFRGQPLAERIEQDGSFKIRESLLIFRKGLEAIAAAHDAQIIHRDIKPENFMIADLGDNDYEVKLMDFGIARIIDDQQEFSDQFFRTMQGKLTGSPAYIAPESITEDKIDGRADLYSMGIFLYELCVGKLPFTAPTATEYLSKHLYEKPPNPVETGAHRGVNQDLGQFILKLMSKLPRERFQTAQEVIDELDSKILPSYGEPKAPQMTMKFDPKKLQDTVDMPAPPEDASEDAPTGEAKEAETANTNGEASAPEEASSPAPSPAPADAPPSPAPVPETPSSEATDADKESSPAASSPNENASKKAPEKSQGWFRRLMRRILGS